MPIEPPDQKVFDAARGYAELSMCHEANEELEIAANAELSLRNLPLGDYHNPIFWVRKELLTIEEFRLRGEILPTDSIVPIGVPQIPRPDCV